MRLLGRLQLPPIRVHLHVWGFWGLPSVHHGWGFVNGAGFGFGGGFGLNGGPGVGGLHRSFGGGLNPAFWHHEWFGKSGFFGGPARPGRAASAWANQGSFGHSTLATANTVSHWWTRGGQGSLALNATTGSRSTQPGATMGRWNVPTSTTPTTSARSCSGGSGVTRIAPRSSSWSVPAYRSPTYSAQRWTTITAARSYASYSGFGARMNAATRFGGGSFGGYPGRFRGGGFHAGGFHGGGGGHREGAPLQCRAVVWFR